TAAYVTLTDSAGNFRLLGIPPGRYRVWAIQDQNNNRRQDRREPFDTVSVTVDSTANAVLWAFVHDTIGPRVRTRMPCSGRSCTTPSARGSAPSSRWTRSPSVSTSRLRS